MVAVFEEIRRVLKPAGTVWLNYGDCYATQPNGRSGADTKAAGTDDRTFRDKPFSTVGAIYDPEGGAKGRGGGPTGKERYRDSNLAGRVCAGGTLKPKDLCMIPNRLAIALQDAGWWVRSEIIWAKPNPMPESIRDRPTSSHEKIFLLSKSARYFYDAEAVRIPAKGRISHDLTGAGYAAPGQTPQNGNRQRYKMPDGWDTGPGGHGSRHRDGREKGAKPDKQRGHSRRHAGFNERWDEMERADQIAGGANLRNVWTIATQPFPDAHFATFPPALVEPCIKAGTSEVGVCPGCGAAWVRQTERKDQGWDGSRYGERAVAATGGAKSGGTARSTLGSSNGRLTGKTETTGWSSSCKCPEHEPVPATVLDPFAGAGTVGLVADRLGRNAILIELNPEYAAMARKRIDTDAATRGTGPPEIMAGNDLPLFGEAGGE